MKETGHRKSPLPARRNRTGPRVWTRSRKLDGKISEEFWQRKMAEWQSDEQRLEAEISGIRQEPEPKRVLNMERTLELSKNAYSLYLTQNSAEQAKLLKIILLNCAVDEVTVCPTYRKPFDLIFNRAKKKNGRGERI